MFVLAANLMINVLSMIWLEIRNEAEKNLQSFFNLVSVNNMWFMPE